MSIGVVFQLLHVIMETAYSAIITRGWPFVALAFGFPLFISLFGKSLASSKPPSQREWHALALAMFMLHQFEEHGYDLFGRRFHFQVFVCQEMGFGIDKLDSCPVSEEYLFAVSVAAWCSGLITVGVGNAYPAAGLSYFAIPFVNSIVHMRPALKDTRYNPGLATAILLLMPISCRYYHHMLKSGIATPPEVAAAVASGIFVHAVMFGTLVAVARNRLSCSSALFVMIQGVLAFVPVITGIVMKQRGDAGVGVRQVRGITMKKKKKKVSIHNDDLHDKAD